MFVAHEIAQCRRRVLVEVIPRKIQRLEGAVLCDSVDYVDETAVRQSVILEVEMTEHRHARETFRKHSAELVADPLMSQA